VRVQHSMACNDLPDDKPYWNYEDIGIFFLILVIIGFVLRLLVRFHLIARSELSNPSVLLQVLLIASLTLALYLVLKLRHHRPVVHSLGWVWPRPVYLIIGLIAGMLLASGVAFYLRYCHRGTPQIGLTELLFLGISLGPVLEESFFRGCLLPLLGQTSGNIVAVILTALLFALFHQPADLGHWVSFTATRVVYGWIRVASRSTVAATLTHATYNFALCLSATL
jgi:membrane protease YdiL (CAAX protease family)